ncbi:SusC/RagA family TonB-linked outer membrane protein [Dysgonomonas reticulitermitis]
MDNLKESKSSMLKKVLCLLVIGLICIFINSYAADAKVHSDGLLEQQQTRITVKGKVIDSSGEPLVGVSVAVKGTTQGVMTDVDGSYSITATSGATLVFSYLGYTSQSKVVGTQTTINITLVETAQTMEEVVVVGYGTQKKENLTGAVTSVDVGKTLTSRPIADVGRGLQGSVPGLSVVVASGEVGSDPIMKIRGAVGSINGSSSPLILVDNVEVPSIQMINPDDIESISVLKDAASTSIYGSKAAFGVVLVTMKKGANTESVTVSYSGNFSWQNRSKPLNMATIDGLQYTLDAYRTRNPESPGTAAVGNMWKMNEESLEKTRLWIEKYGGKVNPTDPVVYGRDWYVDAAGNKLGIRVYDAIDALVADWTPTTTHNLSVTGRNGKTSYNVGLGLLDQSGMTKNAKFDDFRRYNVSIKLSTEINKYLVLRAGAMYSDRIKRFPSVNGYTADPWLYAYRWGSLMPVGTVDQFGNQMRNPAYELAESTTSSVRNIYSNINLGATVNFTKNWNLNFDYTFWTQEDITERSYSIFTGGDTWYGPIAWTDGVGDRVYVNANGDVVDPWDYDAMPAYRFNQISWPGDGTSAAAYINRNSLRTNSHTFNVYTTYNLKLNETNALKFMLGMNSVASDYKSHYGQLTGLYNYENPQFSYATGTPTVSGTAGWSSLLGYFGRANYSFSDRYLLEANLRYDASSKFPSRLWWKAFPAFSAGWVISNEEFFKPVENIFYFAKFRASWGSIGDQSVSNNLYIPSMGGVSKTTWLGSDGTQTYTYATPAAVQRDIKWQRIENLDLGIDLQFLKGDLGVTFDWFRRDTKDMIMAGDALPFTYGASAPQGNYGNLRTKGWEVSVNYNHRFSNGIGISALATVWDNVTYITKGPDWQTPWEDRSIGSTFATGARYGDIWGYVTDRLYQEEDFVRGDDGKFKKVTIILNGTPKQSYMLAGQNPVYQTWFEDGIGVVIFRPGDVKFMDINGDGYITPGRGTFGDPGDRKVIGNSTPRYEYGLRLGADYKGFDLSVFLQGVGKRDIWGSGQLAIPGYHASDGAMPQAIAGDYWRQDRTDAFYPRPWDNQGENTNYSLQVQTRYLLNMAYARIKNITVGYSIPPKLLKKALMSKARFYVSLENFITFDNLSGLPIDPEAISGYSMFSNSYNLGRTGTGTPMFKSASVGVQLSF